MPRGCTAVEGKSHPLFWEKAWPRERARGMHSTSLPQGKSMSLQAGHPIKKSCRKRACLTSQGGWDTAQPSVPQAAGAKPTTWPRRAYCSSRHPSPSHCVRQDVCMGLLAGTKHWPEAFGRAGCGVVKGPEMRRVKMPPGASPEVANSLSLVTWALPMSGDVQPPAPSTTASRARVLPSPGCSCWPFLER